MADRKKILLWGATQVGKTAMLATAFYGSPEVASIRRHETGAETITSQLFDVWKRLRNNQYVPPTSANLPEIVISTRSDVEVVFQDIRGGMTLEPYRDEVREPLHKCDAVLFLAEYSGQDAGNQMAAIEGGLQEIGSKPYALAFTKCERYLKYEDPIWDVEDEWLERTPAWAHYSVVLRRFKGKAWPISAFGYNGARPAITIGEFGQALPFGINPRNVEKPIIHLLHHLEAL